MKDEIQVKWCALHPMGSHGILDGPGFQLRISADRLQGTGPGFAERDVCLAFLSALTGVNSDLFEWLYEQPRVLTVKEVE